MMAYKRNYVLKSKLKHEIEGRETESSHN
jgi:hypothetical protein